VYVFSLNVVNLHKFKINFYLSKFLIFSYVTSHIFLKIFLLKNAKAFITIKSEEFLNVELNLAIFFVNNQNIMKKYDLFKRNLI